MCGRYALGIGAAFVRYQLQQNAMPVEAAPEDDEVRQTFNFAPGNHGLVYRADTPDYGAGPSHRSQEGGQPEEKESVRADDSPAVDEGAKETKYKLQSMKWGLVPFWTKRNPDYTSVLKTINARDDSLMENKGMWTTMKQKKRCIVVAQGFYEWLKKNGGKEKIPHYVKRKDGQLMCFAGLWDCVQYEGSEEKLYTYTIITTDSNKQLKFLHDRMPVILENGSDQIWTWLDPGRYEWSKELQGLLKPFDGELECYPVSKDVGKVGNNSPTFLIPVSSAENKNNIANFFSSPKKAGKPAGSNLKSPSEEQKEEEPAEDQDGEGGDRVTMEEERSEDNAPVPVPADKVEHIAQKRHRTVDDDDKSAQPGLKHVKTDESGSANQPAVVEKTENESKAQQLRSATSNRHTKHGKGSPAKMGHGSRKITQFFHA